MLVPHHGSANNQMYAGSKRIITLDKKAHAAVGAVAYGAGKIGDFFSSKKRKFEEANRPKKIKYTIKYKPYRIHRLKKMFRRGRRGRRY